MSEQPVILVAPLNWGLGHATRCIPIINALLERRFKPLITSDGAALKLLQKEYPHLDTVEFPSYKIEYAKKGKNFKLKLIKDAPHVLEAVAKERKLVKELVKRGKIQGIISDNRLGVYHKKVPSVFITHQLNVLSGKTTWFSSKVHQKIIRKYDECWVPDRQGTPNLSGRLGHLEDSDLPIKYIGPLSRLKKKKMQKIYDLMVVLSGPEPQRTMIENKLFDEIKRFDGNVLFVRGKVEDTPHSFDFMNCEVHNFMQKEALEKGLNQSKSVLCRSGYTSLMDLSAMGKKAFLIPTPGQYEQEYLAQHLEEQKWAPSSSQQEFAIKKLDRLEKYEGLPNWRGTPDFDTLFGLFQGKGELRTYA